MKKNHMQARIKTGCIDEEVVISKTAYRNGVIAISIAALDGEPICVASVNLPHDFLRLDAGETFIKNYSENEGILEELQRVGAVGPTLEEVQSGFVTVQRVKVLF